MKNSFTVFLLVLLLVLIFQESISACSVVEIPLRKQFRRANAVFVGKVLSIIEHQPKEKELLSVPKEWRNWTVWSKVTFEVRKRWKGNISKTQEFVSVAYFVCACSDRISQFERDEEYLIFSETKGFVFVCDSKEIESETAKDEMKRIDNFGFRFWSKIYSF